MALRILYEDDFFVAVDKPAGFHTHSPENPIHRISPLKNARSILIKQLNQTVFPLHRLDVATSGVLVFGKTGETAAQFQKDSQNRLHQKIYLALVWGKLTGQGEIDRPIKDPEPKEALTHYDALATASDGNHTWVKLNPITGRRHQLRRHLKSIGHPIVGDKLYGLRKQDREGNYGFLALKSYRFSCRAFSVQARFTKNWHALFERTGLCPWVL